jgi:hypothetical protein
MRPFDAVSAVGKVATVICSDASCGSPRILRLGDWQGRRRFLGMPPTNRPLVQRTRMQAQTLPPVCMQAGQGQACILLDKA